MIYRIRCSGYDGNAFFLDVWEKDDRPTTPRHRLMGAYAAAVPHDWGRMRRPDVRNKRVHFYFTEAGWREIGRKVTDAARKDGRTVLVVRRKNPKPSEIAYKDDLQVGILPRKGVPRKKRK